MVLPTNTIYGWRAIVSTMYIPEVGTLTQKQPNRTQREKGDTPSKRGSSLIRNYLDQTQSSEFGQKEEGESHLGDDHGA